MRAEGAGSDWLVPVFDWLAWVHDVVLCHPAHTPHMYMYAGSVAWDWGRVYSHCHHATIYNHSPWC